MKEDISYLCKNKKKNILNDNLNKKNIKENDFKLNEDMQLIRDNSKENWNSNNRDNTHTSIISNLKKLIQFDNYYDLLVFISN